MSSSHHRSAETIRHCLRDGFTTYSALSPAIGRSCHRHQRNAQALSPTSRQRRGVKTTRLRRPREKRIRLVRHLRPSHPAPNVRDDREAPLLEERGTAETSGVDLPDIARRKFLTGTLDKFALH